FHTRISEIIRIYIEDRYSIQAMEETSEEILRDLEQNNLCPKEQLDALRDVFFTKVFTSSLRSVDIVPLRGIGANRSEPELGVANAQNIPAYSINTNNITPAQGIYKP
ncbi:MAG: hypothetical protein LBG47_05310, partial [Prevotellaceae bacterium]|nr:hypothetical protein [Prevotellaceae bacterium]